MVDKPYDPNDPDTWEDPSGNQVDPNAPFDPNMSSEGPGGWTGHAQDPNSGFGVADPAAARASMLDGVNHADPSMPDPTAGGPPPSAAEPTPAPPGPPQNPGPQGVGDPGNDANQIQGWASQFLGRNFSDADIAGLAGQPLDLVMHNIANSPEAQAYAASKAPKSKLPLPPGTPPAQPPAYTPPSSIGPNADTSAYNAKLRAFLLSNLSDLSTPTDENSPELAPSLSAYRNQSTRDEQAFRDAAAERYYAQGEGGGAGLSSGGFGTTLTSGMEAAASNRSNFAGNLVWNASQMKRQQLQAMLQTAVNAGETDAAQQIQSQIAGIDANLRSRGLDQQNSQFNDSLAARYAELQAQMNRDQLLAAMKG